MIGSLRGVIVSIAPPHLVVDVQGVGYEVLCCARTIHTFGIMNHPVHLVIETHVRAESLCLYGFETSQERQWFRLLQTVPGVGAKVAIALLSLYTPAQLAQYIQQNQPQHITMAEGVGAKLATRIISELKDKMAAILALMPALAAPTHDEKPSSVSDEVISALTHLGYRPLDAHNAVRTIIDKRLVTEETLSFDDLFRNALQLLGPSS